MKIMKTTKIITLIAICIFAFAATATAQLRFGVKGGVGIIDHKLKSDTLNAKNRLGYSIGPTLELCSPTGWGFDASILYGFKEYSVKDHNKYEGTFELTDYKYVAIPVNLKKRFDLNIVGIYVAAGPYAAVKIDGGDLKEIVSNETVEKFKSKDFEFGINAGFGVSLFSHLDLGLTYKCRLSENFKEDTPKIKDINDKKYQSWEANLTYYF